MRGYTARCWLQQIGRRISHQFQPMLWWMAGYSWDGSTRVRQMVMPRGYCPKRWLLRINGIHSVRIRSVARDEFWSFIFARQD